MHMAGENTILNFGQFTEAVKTRVQELFPDADIRVLPTDKNNGRTLTGLAIREPGSRVTPAIYLNDAYQSYREGAALSGIVAEVAGLYLENRLEEEPEIPDITDFEAVKGLICFRVVDRERNREWLKGMPHRDFLDLAVIYYIPVTVADASGSITVTDSTARLWQACEGDLYRHAVENTKRMLPVELRPVEDIIREALMDVDAPPGQADSVPGLPLYVLRCGKGERATAAAVLYESALREFGRQHGDFYILPSSIHEVILAPADRGAADAGYFCSAVREVNQAHVAPDEVLSDNAYYYHAGTGGIEILS